MSDIIITPDPQAIALAGEIANQTAERHVFSDFAERKAYHTTRRHKADLDLFADFLRSVGLTPGDFKTDPESWRGVTWGLVETFVKWQLGKGYAVPSVNVRLSTVKVYAKLALKAGTLDPTQYALIRAVQGYSHKEQKRIDDSRAEAGTDTRKGRKKAESVSISNAQAQALKSQPADTAQGRRDALIMCLLLDHGLRVGEVAGLNVGDFDLKAGELRFYRPKVDKEQTHRLTPDTLQAARAYFEQDAPALGLVLRGSRRDGSLRAVGMTDRAITERVHILGLSVRLAGLSAHDCRHYWATRAARNGTPIDRLQDAGGWTSPAMPLRYVEAAKIANEGVKLD